MSMSPHCGPAARRRTPGARPSTLLRTFRLEPMLRRFTCSSFTLPSWISWPLLLAVDLKLSIRLTAVLLHDKLNRNNAPACLFGDVLPRHGT